MQTQSFHSQTHLFQGFPLPKRKHKEEFWVSSSTEVPVYAENKIENQILVIPNSLAIACTTHVFTGNNVQKRAQLRGIIQQLITNNRYDCLLELIQKLLGDQAFGTYLNDFYAGNQNANFPTFFIHTRNRLELSELYIYGSGRLGNLEQNLVLHAGAEQQVVWNPFIEDLSHLADSLLDEHESIASTPEIYTTSATHKSFIIGQKRYEISNHLGNVSSVITDRKFGVPLSSTDPTINYYLADIVTATDYDPYGQALPGRVWNRAGYRFGFNGQEFDSELGEIWSAEFCEYDASLGRRWDIDPIDLPWQSPYVAFDCNPIFNSDPKGLMSAPTGDGDGPKTAQKISKKASYTASRASMEQGFKNNKGQYALNIVTSKSNNFNQIHKPNINLVINFTNDKLFDDDSEEILGKASVFYHVDSEWKNQSELKESDLNKINIDTPVEIRVTVTTNIDDEDPLIEIIATLFHELYIHASPLKQLKRKNI